MRAAPTGAAIQMSYDAETSTRTEVDTYYQLTFRSKVQSLVDDVTTCDLIHFTTRLSHVGSALNIFSEARLYILNKPINRVLEADAMTLSMVMEKLETWIDDLGQLPDLESCYAREILNLAYDVIHQQSKGDNASHI